MFRIEYILVLNPIISNFRRANILKNIVGKMGENCEIFKGVNFGSEPYLVELGDNVRITYGVRFITHDGGVHVLRKIGILNTESIYGKIRIGNNVFIGNEAMILPGVEIGDNVIVGARSVVTKSITSNSIVAGCPAKVISDVNSYYEKNKTKFMDTSSKSYKQKKIHLLKTTSDKFINK